MLKGIDQLKEDAESFGLCLVKVNPNRYRIELRGTSRVWNYSSLAEVRAFLESAELFFHESESDPTVSNFIAR